MILANVGQAVPLTLILEDGDAAKFPQALVYLSGANTPLSTVNLVGISSGYYAGSFTVPSSDKFIVVYTVYTDGTYATVDVTHGKSEDLIVSDAGANVVEAQLNVSYDDTLQILRAAAWMDRSGQTVSSPAAATITVKDELDNVLFTQLSTTPFPDGVFFFQQPNVALLDNRIYYVEVHVTDAIGSATTIQTFTTVG